MAKTVKKGTTKKAGKRNVKKPDVQASFPSKAQILEFLSNSKHSAGIREIAKAFHLKGGQRAQLRSLIRELEADGSLDPDQRQGQRRPVALEGRLPNVAILIINHLDRDGDLWARPLQGKGAKPNRNEDDEDLPRIRIVQTHSKYSKGRRTGKSIGYQGQKILARLRPTGEGEYEANIIRVLEDRENRQFLGVLERARDGARLIPTDKRNERSRNKSWFIHEVDMAGATPGEIVLAEALPAGRSLRGRFARVIKRIGDINAPRAFSLIAIHSHELPTEFSKEAFAQAEKGRVPSLGKREDLRNIPLVTIDGEDARDFDDAVFAEPDTSASNPGGYRLVVAIADVAAYVTPESALDICAYERGNSVYFPDQVVPMLPESLSNDLCSLRPGEDRACLAVRMQIDKNGQLLSWKFLRGLMCSVARLTYEQAQKARDGLCDDALLPLMETVIAPLYEAWACLQQDRNRRGTLELDLPELQVNIDEKGCVTSIRPRTRLDSHRVIEEFMICANVAAARALEQAKASVMYRIHEPPAQDKLEALRDSLAAMGFNFVADGEIQPRHFTGILTRAAQTEKAQIISDLVLRAQSQAVYSPDNKGHFGLALERYCHFTSPIRRYSDLLVHRALIAAYGLGAGELIREQAEKFEETGGHISSTERRAMMAERDVHDRYLAAYMAEKIGAEFEGRITGVQRFGLFVRLDETGADGLLPVSRLPNDRYWHDEVRHRLAGQRHRLAFELGQRICVRLLEAKALTGGLLLEIVSGGKKIKGAVRPLSRRSRRHEVRSYVGKHRIK